MLAQVSMAAMNTNGRTSTPPSEKLATVNKGSVERSGNNIPETRKSRLDKAIALLVRIIEYAKWVTTPIIAPNKVPKATPIPPKRNPRTMLMRRLLRASEADQF
jgi:hypothetical protein